MVQRIEAYPAVESVSDERAYGDGYWVAIVVTITSGVLLLWRFW